MAKDTKDTLRSLALDWKAGLIDDAEARRRAKLLDYPVYHRDGSRWGEGDGGWYEGEEDNTSEAVEALALDNPSFSGEDVDRFFDVIR